MEKSGFFNANLVGDTFDRTYLADAFARYFASFMGNGVFGKKSNELQVLASVVPNMQVRLLSGQGYINGYWYENTEQMALSFAQANGINPRIDTVVLRWKNSEREITAEVVQGTPALSPSAPALRRNADYFELKLCNVRVRAGAVNIQQSDITDTRLDATVCGFVAGLVQQFDTTYFGVQLQTFINDYMSSADADYSEFISSLDDLRILANVAYNDMLEYFNGLMASGDAALADFVANLQQQSTDAAATISDLVSQLEGLFDEEAVAQLTLRITNLEASVAFINFTIGQISTRSANDWNMGDGTNRSIAQGIADAETNARELSGANVIIRQSPPIPQTIPGSSGTAIVGDRWIVPPTVVRNIVPRTVFSTLNNWKVTGGNITVQPTGIPFVMLQAPTALWQFVEANTRSSLDPVMMPLVVGHTYYFMGTVYNVPESDPGIRELSILLWHGSGASVLAKLSILPSDLGLGVQSITKSVIFTYNGLASYPDVNDSYLDLVVDISHPTIQVPQRSYSFRNFLLLDMSVDYIGNAPAPLPNELAMDSAFALPFRESIVTGFRNKFFTISDDGRYELYTCIVADSGRENWQLLPPANHAAPNSKFGAAAEGVWGHAMPGGEIPPRNDAVAGSSGTPGSVFANDDHRHPASNRIVSYTSPNTSLTITETYARPSTNGTLTLGAASQRWSVVYAVNTAISTSDGRQKNVVGAIDCADKFIMGIEPVAYYWKDPERDNGTLHYGFIAQKVKAALEDAGVYGEVVYRRDSVDDDISVQDVDEDHVVYGLAYEEIIAPLVAVVQKLAKKVEMLEERLAEMSK